MERSRRVGRVQRVPPDSVSWWDSFHSAHPTIYDLRTSPTQFHPLLQVLLFQVRQEQDEAAGGRLVGHLGGGGAVGLHPAVVVAPEPPRGKRLVGRFVRSQRQPDLFPAKPPSGCGWPSQLLPLWTKTTAIAISKTNHLC